MICSDKGCLPPVTDGGWSGGGAEWGVVGVCRWAAIDTPLRGIRAHEAAGRSADQGLLRGWGGGVGVLHDEHVGGVGAERDAFALECLDDAAAEFAQDGILLADADADADGVDDLATFDLIEAGDVGIRHGDLGEGGVLRTSRATLRRMARTWSGSALASTLS